MTLVYQSTRDEKNTVTASQAILQGLATDGGLFTPVSYPQVELDFDTLKDASYQEVAKLVLSAFLDDFTAEELDYCISHAYDSKFDTPAIAPLVKLDGQYNLELFHGSTIAFKDMALSILPYFMTTAAKKHGLENKIVILTATSGDTGKAAAGNEVRRISTDSNQYATRLGYNSTAGSFTPYNIVDFKSNTFKQDLLYYNTLSGSIN